MAGIWGDVENVAKGVGGSIAGQALGSVAGGPLGAVVGGGAGSMPGWYNQIAETAKDLFGGVSVPKAKGYDVDPTAFQNPYHDPNAQRFWGGAEAAGSRQGPQQFRTGQADLISILQGAVAGNAPSVAENQLRAGMDRNLAGAQSLQASGLGSTNPALASRAIGMAQAGVGQATARDAATLRAQEIAQARGELGNVLGQARGGDLQQQQMNDELMSKYLALGYSNDQAQFQATQDLEALRVQEALGQQGINAQTQAGNRDFWGNLIGAGAGAAGAVIAKSDERTKTNVQPGGSEVKAFLDQIAAKGYDYKPGVAGTPGAAPGRHVGVMAQDLESAGPVGAGMVRTAPSGTKMVDAGQAATTALAASADMNERLKRLERPAAPDTRYQRGQPSVGSRMISWIMGQPAARETATGGGTAG